MTINAPVVWPRPLPPSESWWTGIDRATFTARVHDEAKRMAGSQGERMVHYLDRARHVPWLAASSRGSVKGGSHD